MEKRYSFVYIINSWVFCFLSADVVQDPWADCGGWENSIEQTCLVISDELCWSLINSTLRGRKVNKLSNRQRSNQHAPLKIERWQISLFLFTHSSLCVSVLCRGITVGEWWWRSGCVYTLIKHFILLSLKTFFSYLLDFDVWYNLFCEELKRITTCLSYLFFSS